MRIGTVTVILLLVAPTLAAQTGAAVAKKKRLPAAAAAAAATTVAAATTTAAANPCASQQVVEVKPGRAKLMSEVAVAHVVAMPSPQPTVVFQQLDPIRAIDMAWNEASEQVMTLLKAKHTLTDDEVNDIQSFDDSHTSARDRFIFRMNLLTQAVEQ